MDNFSNDKENKTYLREEYVSRINRVMDYIENNLEEELSLDRLAKVACFSRFHFHRIFRGMVGETLNQFIQRVRVEKAATQLLANPKKSITAIAFDCGFSGSAAFARAFKDVLGVSASQWRISGKISDSKICKTKSKNDKLLSNMRKDFVIESPYIDPESKNQIWRIKMVEKIQAQIEVKELPEMQAAYVRNIGPYKGNKQLFEGLFGKLMKWAGPRGLIRFPETKMLTVYHDDPEVTEEKKLRISVCITVPEDTAVDGEIGLMKIPGGKYAVAKFEIDTDQFEAVWDAVCGQWLPESGYQPDDRLCYEVCLNDPNEHPEKKHIVEICVPVKPL